MAGRNILLVEGTDDEHVEQSIDAIPKAQRRFSDLDKPKAVIHTWLAWQKEPGKPFGTVITARYLDANVPQVIDFINWLKELFFPSFLTPGTH